MENIRFGSQNATETEIMDAAKKAAADDFICELTGGYSALVGPHGNLLSGGQRQRIAIARAILKMLLFYLWMRLPHHLMLNLNKKFKLD